MKTPGDLRGSRRAVKGEFASWPWTLAPEPSRAGTHGTLRTQALLLAALLLTSGCSVAYVVGTGQNVYDLHNLAYRDTCVRQTAASCPARAVALNRLLDVCEVGNSAKKRPGAAGEVKKAIRARIADVHAAEVTK